MTATPRSEELRSIAQRIADALPATVGEVVVTGSVSRGVADDVSDIEMLIVTSGELELEECFSLAAACGLTDLGTWGQQGVPAKRVSGYREGVPIELIWWSSALADATVDAVVAGDPSSTADALANGIALRTSGLLAQWQARLRHYPDELAAARIEDAALTWGGFAPAGLLTLLRDGDRLALVERLVDDASRVVRIVFAMNRVWQPTHKRLADRAVTLARKPDRLAERIEEALTEPDPGGARHDGASGRDCVDRARRAEHRPRAEVARRCSRDSSAEEELSPISCRKRRNRAAVRRGSCGGRPSFA